MNDPIERLLVDEEVNNQIYNTSFEWFKQLGLGDHMTHILNSIALLVAVFVVLVIVDFIVRKVLIGIFSRLLSRSSQTWYGFLIRNKFFSYLSMVILLMVANGFVPLIFRGFPTMLNFLDKTFSIIIAIFVLNLVNSLLKTARDFLKTRKAFVDKPLDSYAQVLQIFLIFIGGAMVFTILTGKTPTDFLISMGAASAILMLVFKDTILGFVASIQVSANDSVKVGDWIEMSKYGADGDVIQINLNNIRVRNFDRTIVTIPTYTLLSESFTNWRGMEQSGGRRIKRAVNIKISSIRYMSEDEIEELKKISLLKPYIEERQKEIEDFNNEHHTDTTVLVNGRRMTNAGLFRAYLTAYAKAHPHIHKEATTMVRQLAPNQYGLPLELYMFTAGTAWLYYEGVMADVFDHLFAAVKYFDLEVFESPASDDLRRIPLNVLQADAAAAKGKTV